MINFPNSPTNGQTAILAGRSYTFDGTAWRATTPDLKTVTSATPPSNPADGLLWWDSVNGTLMVYYNDGDTPAWTAASPVADSIALTGTPTAPTAAPGTNTTQIATTEFVDALRSVPRSTTTTTAVIGDRGKCIALTAGITIPANVYAAGDAVSLYNDSAADVTITQGASLTLRQAGTANTGNRTLAARGMATVWFNSATEAIISGAGVT